MTVEMGFLLLKASVDQVLLPIIRKQTYSDRKGGSWNILSVSLRWGRRGEDTRSGCCELILEELIQEVTGAAWDSSSNH